MLSPYPEGRHYRGLTVAASAAVILGGPGLGVRVLAGRGAASARVPAGCSGSVRFAAVGGGDVHVDHLNGGEFFEQATRGQTRRQSFQTMADGDVEAVGEEGDEDVGFDALRLLMVDRPDGEIALEVSKRFLHSRA